MGYRTHISLSVKGPEVSLGTFTNLPSAIFLFQYECLGKNYFNSLEDSPAIYQALHDAYPDGLHGMSFPDGSDDGEITVEFFLKFIDIVDSLRTDRNEDDDWFDIDYSEFKMILEEALKQGLIESEDWIQVECW